MGKRSPTSEEKPPGTETEKFLIIYRFNAIRAFGVISRLKVAQTAMSVLALPPGYYWYSQGHLTLNSLCLATGIAGFALAMLCWMSYFFRRLVGILYVNESGTVLRVSHLSFWGWRQDTYCPVLDVMPLTESNQRPQDMLMCIQQYTGKQTFYLTLPYGHIVDRERFTQIFGEVGTLNTSKMSRDDLPAPRPPCCKPVVAPSPTWKAVEEPCPASFSDLLSCLLWAPFLVIEQF
ncbi:Transmembrane protein 186 [Heterocephalus glaber]|uniref:Transmembrane protein 186 n=1 Tax=Heterocephalus glaber TaxID=10181 RepID=G5BSC9_HETGA|nr:Transmembrane protein 186 [Heterocephalus glaber]